VAGLLAWRVGQTSAAAGGAWTGAASAVLTLVPGAAPWLATLGAGVTWVALVPAALASASWAKGPRERGEATAFALEAMAWPVLLVAARLHVARGADAAPGVYAVTLALLGLGALGLRAVEGRRVADVLSVGVVAGQGAALTAGALALVMALRAVPASLASLALGVLAMLTMFAGARADAGTLTSLLFASAAPALACALPGLHAAWGQDTAFAAAGVVALLATGALSPPVTVPIAALALGLAFVRTPEALVGLALASSLLALLDEGDWTWRVLLDRASAAWAGVAVALAGAVAWPGATAGCCWWRPASCRCSACGPRAGPGAPHSPSR
jgi:hypothetical protein